MRDRPLVLVDTNIWLDNYLGFRPGSTTSRAFFEAATLAEADLFYPAHIARDVAYLVESLLKQDSRESGDSIDEAAALAAKQIARSCVQNMSELATAIGADGSDVWLALKYWSLTNDMEDALVIAAAERAGVDMIVTRDKKLASKAPFPVFSPEDSIALFEMNRQG